MRMILCGCSLNQNKLVPKENARALVVCNGGNSISMLSVWPGEQKCALEGRLVGGVLRFQIGRGGVEVGCLLWSNSFRNEICRWNRSGRDLR